MEFGIAQASLAPNIPLNFVGSFTMISPWEDKIHESIGFPHIPISKASLSIGVDFIPLKGAVFVALPLKGSISTPTLKGTSPSIHSTKEAVVLPPLKRCCYSTHYWGDYCLSGDESHVASSELCFTLEGGKPSHAPLPLVSGLYPSRASHPTSSKKRIKEVSSVHTRKSWWNFTFFW